MWILIGCLEGFYDEHNCQVLYLRRSRISKCLVSVVYTYNCREILFCVVYIRHTSRIKIYGGRITQLRLYQITKV